MKRHFFIFLALAGIGVLVVALSRTGSDTVELRPQVASATDADPAAAPRAGLLDLVPPPAEPHCLPEAGDELAWQVSWSRQTVANLGPASAWGAGVQQMDHGEAGRLHARVLQRDDAGALLLARFVDFTSSERPSWNHGARSPFLFRLDAACAIDGYAHHVLTVPAHARAQQALLSTLTWRWTAEPVEAVDDNDLGTAHHVFVAATVDAGVLAQRTVQRYAAFWNGEAGMRPLESRFSFEVTPGGWFQRGEGQEVIAWGEGRVVRRLSARRIAFQEDALAEATEDLDAYRWANLLPQHFAGRRAPREITEDDRQFHAMVRHRDAAAAVEWFMDDLAAERPAVELVPELGLWLESRPDETEAFVQLLAEGGLPTQTINAMYMAMGLARTPESRTWLEYILEDESAPVMDRVRAMHNLMDRDDVGMHHAADFARRALAYRSAESNEDRFVGRQAIMALGAFAAMQQDPEIVALAKSVTGAALEAADDADSLRPVIGALANLGDPSSLEAVERFTVDPRYEVRLAAARIIRRMDPADTERFLVDWLSREPSVFVRSEVWNTHKRQLHDADEPLSEALRPIAVHHLREGNLQISATSALIGLLGPLANEDPEVRQVLIATARTDHDGRSGIRRQVVRWLEIEGVQEVYR